MNCFADPCVSATATDVRDLGIDISVGRCRFFLEECGSGHDHTGLTIPALRNLFRDPCLLERMSAVGREPFDSEDFFSYRRRHRENTGADRLAVEMHSARTAQRHAAPVLRTGETNAIS